MAPRKIRILTDSDRVSLGIVKLNDSQDVNGTASSTQSAAINGHAVRYLVAGQYYTLRYRGEPDCTCHKCSNSGIG